MIEKSIVFVTTNKGKVSTAQQYFNKVKLEIYNYELIEPRSDDIKEIAKSKVMQAYEIVKKPCIALDSGFFIEALNGFPKAFVNFALNTIGIEGILKLMEGKENRNCYFDEYLAYYDGNNFEFFSSKENGKVVEQICESNNDKKWSELWRIYVPGDSNDGKTLSEYSEEQIYKRRNSINSSIKQFAKWYENKLD